MSQQLPILLVQLPWAALHRPSLQLGLVRALLEEQGLQASVVPLNLALARRLGPERYAQVSGGIGRGVGEWLFARALFGPALPDYLSWIAEHHPARLQADGTLDRSLRRLAEEEIPAFVQEASEELDRLAGGGPAVFGFGCTHDQLLAALCLARPLRTLHEGSRIVLGGAQVAGAVGSELLGAFDWLDWVVDGEAEAIAGPLFAALAAGEEPTLPHDAHGRGRGVIHASSFGAPRTLDSLPVPRYDEYLQARPDELTGGIRLPIELSRGCWWATSAEGPCSFCGICVDQARYRRKSPARVAAELARLAETTWILDYSASDAVLPRRADEALAETRRSGDFTLTAELRAGASTEEIGRLARAGLVATQPGIEAFDSEQLRHLRKGRTLLDNVGLLRALAQHGVEASYNLLYGAPGEPPGAFERTLELLPLLRHLPCPLHLVRINLVRGSVYCQSPEEHGIRSLRPAALYGFLFPAGRVDPARIAYLFDGELDDATGSGVVDRLHEALLRWHEALSRGARLVRRRGPGLVQIMDARQPEAPRSMVLQGDLAELLLACEDPTPVAAAARALGWEEARAAAAAAGLVERELMLVEDGGALALPVAWDAPGVRVGPAPVRLDGGFPWPAPSAPSAPSDEPQEHGPEEQELPGDRAGR